MTDRAGARGQKSPKHASTMSRLRERVPRYQGRHARSEVPESASELAGGSGPQDTRGEAPAFTSELAGEDDSLDVRVLEGEKVPHDANRQVESRFEPEASVAHEPEPETATAPEPEAGTAPASESAPGPVSTLAPARFSFVCESQDGRLCLFEDADGHFSVVRAARLV